MDSLGWLCGWFGGFGWFSRFSRFLALRFDWRFVFDQLTSAPALFNLGPGRCAESMRSDGQFACQFTIAKNFDQLFPAFGQAQAAQSRLVNRGAFVEIVQRFQIDRYVTHRKALVVKAALGNAADQRHLAAFKTDADGTARTG